MMLVLEEWQSMQESTKSSQTSTLPVAASSNLAIPSGKEPASVVAEPQSITTSCLLRRQQQELAQQQQQQQLQEGQQHCLAGRSMLVAAVSQRLKQYGRAKDALLLPVADSRDDGASDRALGTVIPPPRQLLLLSEASAVPARPRTP